ncbi:MAG: dihydropteroate synthase [Candidatus Kapaibacterium sp.]
MNFPKIMGIVNVTPDSFSDGGKYNTVEQAISHALQLVDEGADILDIGGESTRPGSESVLLKDELERVIPVIQGIRAVNRTIPISIDTMKAEVAQQACNAGATMINDVSAGRFDENMFTVAMQAAVPVVLMHMLGKPKTMQENPTYDNVVQDVYSFLEERVTTARNAGVTNVMIDVGIGFGKTLEHNLELLRNHAEFAKLNVPVVLGISRKRFIGALTGVENAADRDTATALLHALLLQAKADIIRVHNVAVCNQLRTLANAL